MPGWLDKGGQFLKNVLEIAVIFIISYVEMTHFGFKGIVHPKIKVMS